MAITFYSAPMSSASPVAAALAELNVPHETVTLDLKAGDQKKPAYLALNPNGKVPTLVADGTPMFEALAIMQWLGDRFGVAKGLWPAADSPARMQAMAWSTWAYVTYGTTLVMLQLAVIYLVTGLLKNGGVWLAGDSLYYALNLDHFYRLPPQYMSSIIGTQLFRAMTRTVKLG